MQTTPPAQPLSEAALAAASGASGVLALVGNTPLVPIRTLCPNPRVRILAKVESRNPGGSVKDRIGLAMIEAAERSGELTREKTVLEATSGNTGIGLAMVCAVKGYRLLLAMSAGVSVERRKILSAYGAEFLLTPSEFGTDGAIEKAYALAREEPARFHLTDQYNNAANPLAHYHGTALEIWNQTGGQLSHFVASIGTTGTVVGCARRLHELDPKIRVVAVEPYLGHRIQGLKNLKEAYVPGIYDRRIVDEKVNVEDEAAYETARRLARDEGLLCGMSSGAAMRAALDLATTIETGTIVVLLPDGGERYLSTSLFQVAQEEAPPPPEAKLRFFDTAQSRDVVFEPQAAGEVTMYTCGPTTHRAPSIGLYRRVVLADLCRRTLEARGLSVRHVMNFTDIDDKTMAEAERTGETLAALFDRVASEFHEDCRWLRVRPAEVYPRVSEHVEEMIALTRTLVERGFAYEKLHSVYFNVARFADYGKLSGVDLDRIRVGATVDLESYEKENPRDFTLLKRSTLGEIRRGISYKTEFGSVRPSWHIECAALAMKHLGETFDLHVGGVDLIFPHHENEIATCQAATGKRPARYWLHSELVMAGGKKMSFASGNAVTVGALRAEGRSWREVRLLLLQTHYRQPLQFSAAALDAARTSLARIDELRHKLATLPPGEHEEVSALAHELEVSFRDALADDLNVAAGLGALFSFVRRCNSLLASGRLGAGDAPRIEAALAEVDRVLALLEPGAEGAAEPVPDEVGRLLEAREAARGARDFAEADRLRDAIAALGYQVDDTPAGPRLRRAR
jgi:cysteinyl-tRNA synthetase